MSFPFFSRVYLLYKYVQHCPTYTRRNSAAKFSCIFKLSKFRRGRNALRKFAGRTGSTVKLQAWTSCESFVSGKYLAPTGEMSVLKSSSRRVPNNAAIDSFSPFHRVAEASVRSECATRALYQSFASIKGFQGVRYNNPDEIPLLTQPRAAADCILTADYKHSFETATFETRDAENRPKTPPIRRPEVRRKNGETFTTGRAGKERRAFRDCGVHFSAFPRGYIGRVGRCPGRFAGFQHGTPKRSYANLRGDDLA